MADKSTTPYPANQGQIASPQTVDVVDSLNRGTGNSMPVKHNEHLYGGGGKGGSINTPADPIVKSLKETSTLKP